MGSLAGAVAECEREEMGETGAKGLLTSSYKASAGGISDGTFGNSQVTWVWRGDASVEAVWFDFPLASTDVVLTRPAASGKSAQQNTDRP